MTYTWQSETTNLIKLSSKMW